MKSILHKTDHRPWPLPSRPWGMAMRWHDLLFAHWPVEPAEIQSLLPTGLKVDTYDGAAWVGVVPFWMSGVRARCMPPLPSFPEINVRTYAVHNDRPGVYFFSLDAHNRLAVGVARRFFQLPYYLAAMSCTNVDDTIHYSSDRRTGQATFRGIYRPVGDVFESESKSLEQFLTERYCLYTARRDGTLYSCDIHHIPWPLQRAELNIGENTMAAAAGITLPDKPPMCLFAKQLNVVAWTLQRV